MYTIGQENNQLLIDLITLDGRRFSIREFLLSYNICTVDNTVEVEAAKNVHKLVEAIVRLF